MSEIFSYTRCPKLSKSSLSTVFGGCTTRRMRPEASRRSRLPSAPAPSVSWKNPTERWTQKQPPQRTEESVILGGPGHLFPLGKLGKLKKWRNLKLRSPKILGEFFILEEWEVAICDVQFILPVNG